MKQLSFNEFYTLLKRSARGAGLEWGYAEELGYSACWLVKYNAIFDHDDNANIADYVLDFLLDYQQNVNAYNNPDLERITQGYFVHTDAIQAGSNSENKLNPLVVATLISDLVLLDKAVTIYIENIAFPLLVLPYCVQRVTIDILEHFTSAQALSIQLLANPQGSVLDLSNIEQAQRVNIRENTLERLEQLLLTMCVAESEASLKDAG